LDLDRGEPLDPQEGSRIGALQEKAREFGCGDHEIARSDIPTVGGSGGHNRVGKWNTGGTKPRDLAVRSFEVLVLGSARREVLKESRTRAHHVALVIRTVHQRGTRGA
jgi:hypothetical protein